MPLRKVTGALRPTRGEAGAGSPCARLPGPGRGAGAISRGGIAAAIRSCPRELAWSRSSLQSRGSHATGQEARSTRRAPVRAETSRRIWLSCSTRGTSHRAAGITGDRSGSVKVTRVAPCPMRARCIASMSSPTCSASNRRRTTSLVPENRVTRSGPIARAGATRAPIGSMDRRSRVSGCLTYQ